MINANAARRISNEAKQKRIVEEAKSKRETALDKSKSVRNQNINFYKQFDSDINQAIENATDAGEFETFIHLSRNRRDLYTELNSEEPIWGPENFIKNARFAKQVLSVMEELKTLGFAVELFAANEKHDERTAWMNGGQGREEVYYTNNTVLKISWEEKR